MAYKRFFPGPQGTGAAIVVPMTDFSLPEIDGDRLTDDALAKIIERTGSVRQRLRSLGLAQGNKVASNQRILRDQVTNTEIVVELYEGPSLREDVSYKLKLPQTPATLRAVPTTFEQLREIYADRLMGGNVSNVLRNQIHIAQSGIGAEQLEFFTPPDKYLDEWLEDKLQNGVDKQFRRNELTGIDPRTGLALPYDENGKLQPFSFNTPQGSTIAPMAPLIDRLQGINHVVVSEGLGSLLAQNHVDIAQVFNPTSALHTESALEMYNRRQSGIWQDITIVNDAEMKVWIQTMENKHLEIPMSKIEDAPFPMPFLRSEPTRIDENSIPLMRRSHQRFMNLGEVSETEQVNLVFSVGCGPKGGQNHFQSRGRHFIAAASTISDDGARRLVEQCGSPSGLMEGEPDAVGAGDAAFTASLLQRLYAPLEDIIERRHPNLSDERKRIASMAFTTLLQRVFGELVYRSKMRDLTAVPPEAFPRIFDSVLDKSIAAAHKLTTIDKVPSNVFVDQEWGVSFMVMEVERLMEAHDQYEPST